MDADRFESFLRSLSASPSRRSALRLLAGVVLGSPLAFGVAGTEAHNKRQKCKQIEDKDKRKKCLTKAKKHNATHTTSACPPVCPVCQGCNATSGLCEAQVLQGLSAPGCAAPKVCCGGACCDPIHQCNSAGACTTCAEVCPDTCGTCFHLADGSTRCGDSATTNACDEPCSSPDDCPPERPHCLASFTTRSGNFTNVVCSGTDAEGGVCVSITDCA